MSKKQEWLDWVNSRPQQVRELIKAYPPGTYIMKEWAPYAISCPGTKVFIISWGEDGKVGAVVTPENKLPSAIEHEMLKCIEHGTLENYEKIKNSPVKVRIDPKYMELLELEDLDEE